MTVPVTRLARQALGIERLRAGQHEAVHAVTEGRDTLVVMPTGSGKSAIYQLAGEAIPGPTVVVSPLLALQHDQLAALAELEVGAAAAVSSDVSAEERERALAAAAAGELEFLFLAPEQLTRPEVLDTLAGAGVSLVAVDEAHCVSSWGLDFRPAYLRLRAAIESFGRPTVLALTATASPPTQQEIVERLGLDDPMVVVRGFDRPNIHLAVRRPTSTTDVDARLADLVAEADGPTIVYAATRRDTEETAARLGDRAGAFHSGLPRGERQRVQDGFMAGDLDVVVATSAFGMGIDKPDVRLVVHRSSAPSLDDYHQQIGRAGRDGEPARAVMLHRPEDLGRWRGITGRRQAGEAELRDVLDALDRPRHLDELAEQLDRPPGRVAVAVSWLEQAGALHLAADGTAERTGAGRGVAAEAAAAAAVRRRIERTKGDMVRAYAEASGCRRQVLLGYYGEALPEPCGNCDVCARGPAPAAAAPQHAFTAGTGVEHEQWGPGEVLRADDEELLVAFEREGYKTLSVALVEEGDLLEVT